MNQIIPRVYDKAAQYGHKGVVEFLANKGSNIKYKDNNGSTALVRGIFLLRRIIINFFHLIK